MDDIEQLIDSSILLIACWCDGSGNSIKEEDLYDKDIVPYVRIRLMQFDKSIFGQHIIVVLGNNEARIKGGDRLSDKCYTILCNKINHIGFYDFYDYNYGTHSDTDSSSVTVSWEASTADTLYATLTNNTSSITI